MELRSRLLEHFGQESDLGEKLAFPGGGLSNHGVKRGLVYATREASGNKAFMEKHRIRCLHDPSCRNYYGICTRHYFGSFVLITSRIAKQTAEQPRANSLGTVSPTIASGYLRTQQSGASFSCPLCRSPENRILETLRYKLLRKLYRRFFHIELERSSPDIDLRVCERCDLRFYSPPLIGDEKFYEALQSNDWYYLTEKEEFNFAARYISAQDQVLEVGTGRGAFADKIACQSYEGLELSLAAVNMARQRGLSVHQRTIQEHAKDHAGAYDVVCSFQVLEHVPDPLSFLESSLCCLREGGKLIQSVPREDGFVGSQSNNILNMPPHHATRWSDRALHSVASVFELEILDSGYDTLSDLHIPGYSTALIETSINNLLGRSRQSLDPYFASFFVKVPVRMGSLFLEKALKNGSALRPGGHSITVVYRKSGSKER